MGTGHPNVVHILRRRMLANKLDYIIDMEILAFPLSDYMYSADMTPRVLQPQSPYYKENKNVDKSSTMWDIMSQITLGLAFIHQNNVVHGNLKPSNGNFAPFLHLLNL